MLTVAKSTNFVATLHCKSLSTASERLDPVWSNRRWLTKHNLENLETSCANPHKSIQDLSLSFWDFPKTNANRILPKRATHVSESPWTTHKQPKKVLARGWSNFRCVAQLVGVRLRVGWVTRVWNCTVMKFEGPESNAGAVDLFSGEFRILVFLGKGLEKVRRWCNRCKMARVYNVTCWNVKSSWFIWWNLCCAVCRIS